MTLDLESPYLAEVKGILQRHVPGLTVWAFGSRVTGRVKRFSDLDLVLVGPEGGKPLPIDTVWTLRESFSDSDLPFRVDVVDLASVTEDFKSIIEKNHTVLQG